MSAIDIYLENVTPEQKVALEHIRQLVKSQLPDAEEVISYGMPTFKYKRKNLLHFAGFKDHMSLFPTGDEAVKAIKGVDRYQTSKGTLQFSTEDPIPDDMIKQIIICRIKSIDNGSTY